MAAKQYQFGVGNLYFTPVGGGAPVAFGAVQDVSVDFSGDTKALYGQNSFPLDVARGKVKIEGKASFGQLNLAIYNALFFGQTVAAGQNVQAFNEASVVPASTPYTVTAANGATFKQDLGVFYASNGQPLKQVASNPSTGQYSLGVGGVYTFAAGDSGKAVVFNYLYGDAVNGQTLTVNNPIMGSMPTFQLVLSSTTKGNSSVLTLLCCTSTKLTLPFKQEDYLVPQIDFQAQDDSTGRVFTWSQTATA